MPVELQTWILSVRMLVELPVALAWILVRVCCILALHGIRLSDGVDCV